MASLADRRSVRAPRQGSGGRGGIHGGVACISRSSVRGDGLREGARGAGRSVRRADAAAEPAADRADSGSCRAHRRSLQATRSRRRRRARILAGRSRLACRRAGAEEPGPISGGPRSPDRRGGGDRRDRRRPTVTTSSRTMRWRGRTTRRAASTMLVAPSRTRCGPAPGTPTSWRMRRPFAAARQVASR